eukprot:Awhi_evm1s567
MVLISENSAFQKSYLNPRYTMLNRYTVHGLKSSIAPILSAKVKPVEITKGEWFVRPTISICKYDNVPKVITTKGDEKNDENTKWETSI